MRILELCLDCEKEEDPPPVFLEAWLGLLVDDMFPSFLLLQTETQNSKSHCFAYEIWFSTFIFFKFNSLYKYFPFTSPTYYKNRLYDSKKISLPLLNQILKIKYAI